ncbi:MULTISPECIES: DUF1634 domain-containing protein [Aphanizomenonaceae]|uniref:DUF1634 domain-containing protein n=1 Tax=Dolichospermum heterosporum TAC447 TaxID=747523 RepID=A0ABY5LUH7_9CYAN|nr:MULTISPECIES: DUF1634 domain-containing protein [Aphanizomenonaceae]MBE9259842.1 DUF1634 domain-containing protein [Dolichospermum sp. LEGE 00246]UUO15355.1 DUF1634 domain-containing protein [Dolichospermum heterosporum TAC447]
MYKLNSGFRWTCTTEIERKVGNFTFQLEERDCDIQQLEEQRLSHHDENLNHQKFTKSANEKQLEYLLSNLLKYGVLIASSIVLFGGILYLINHGSEPAEYQIFRGTPSEFHSPTGVVNAVLAGSRRGIIQLGLLILIAIPILRVIISFCTFLLQRNFVYVIITSLVLASLTYSLLGAYY